MTKLISYLEQEIEGFSIDFFNFLLAERGLDRDLMIFRQEADGVEEDYFHRVKIEVEQYMEGVEGVYDTLTPALKAREKRGTLVINEFNNRYWAWACDNKSRNWRLRERSF